MSSPGFLSAPSADWILCVYLDSIIYGLSNGLRWLALSQALAICSLELVMWRYGYLAADQNEQKFGFCPLVPARNLYFQLCQPRPGDWQPPHPGGGQPDIVFGMRDNERNVTGLNFHLRPNLISKIMSKILEHQIREMDNRDVGGNRFRFLSQCFWQFPLDIICCVRWIPWIDVEFLVAWSMRMCAYHLMGNLMIGSAAHSQLCNHCKTICYTSISWGNYNNIVLVLCW